MANLRKTSLIVAALFMAAGFVAWLYQFQEGLILTDLSNSFSWGLYISGLAFFVGNAAGGLVLSSSIYLFGLTKLKPFAKIGALTAFANVTAAMLIVLPDMGQPLRLWHLLIYPKFDSPLVWDVLVLNLYAVLSLTYLYILMLPDLNGRLRRFAIKVKDPKEFSEKWAKKLSPFALVFAISIHVVTAWIFSTQGGREWWFTPTLAPDFLSVAVMAGTTVVLMASVLAFGIKDAYKDAYRTMIGIITAFFIIHMFLMYNDFFIKIWYGAESSMHTLGLVFGEYLRIHALEVIAPLLAVLLLSRKSVRESKIALVASSLLLLVGVFAHRFLLMPPAFEAIPLTFNPIGLQDMFWSYPIASGRYIEGVNTFVDKWNYFPTIVEFTILSGVIAYMYFVVAAGTEFLPIVKKEPEIKVLEIPQGGPVQLVKKE
ncbi:MAG: polysulfide reductase NrfD [Candidatus Methanoperedens sp.]|nr:polysulfide reductase NrfD [Candidatus Methanoperedens sp.]